MQETWVRSLGWEDPLEDGMAAHNTVDRWASPQGLKELDKTEWLSKAQHSMQDTVKVLVAQMVKNPPALQKTWVWLLGWEDPLKKEMATYSRILA